MTRRCRYMTMGFFFSCKFIHIKMKIKLSSHSSTTELILNKLPGQRFVLFFCKFSVQRKLKFSPYTSVTPLFSRFSYINKSLNAFCTIFRNQLLNFNSPFRSILWKNKFHMLHSLILIIKGLACLRIIKLTTRSISNRTYRISATS